VEEFMVMVVFAQSASGGKVKELNQSAQQFVAGK